MKIKQKINECNERYKRIHIDNFLKCHADSATHEPLCSLIADPTKVIGWSR